MGEFLQLTLPFVAALGAGLLSFIVVHARMQVVIARGRQDLIEARAVLAQQRQTAEEKIKAAGAEARRKALDEFLADVRVEERHYVREISSPAGSRKCLVLQERIYFRNIPLCDWIERELPVEQKRAERIERLQEGTNSRGRKLLR